MAYNIGPKIGIDGEAEFRRQISQINTEYKTLVAQTKAVTAEFDKNGDEQGKLRATAAKANRQSALQGLPVGKCVGEGKSQIWR